LQETVVKSFAALVNYLDGHTSRTVVLNQLKEIGTPDVAKVVEALSGLHATLKTHKNTDLSEVTKVMKGILDEAKKIPKEHAKTKEQKFVDYTKQIDGLSKTIKAVEDAVKAQKIKVEAPVVNVEAPQVTVDAPDLKPISKEIEKAFKEAVLGIKMPEHKPTDITPMVDEQKKTNHILENLPLGGGGSGGTGASYVDASGNTSLVELDSDGNVPVMPKNGLLPFKWDDLTFSNPDGNGNYQTGVVKSETVTVATLELTYDGSDKLTRIRRV